MRPTRNRCRVSSTDRFSALTRVAAWAIASPVFRRSLSILRGEALPIFLLHRMAQPDVGINGHTPEQLDDILGGLRTRGFSFVSVVDLLNAAESRSSLPSDAVCFTMDDGYWDQAEVAAPVFLAHRVPLTIFVVTDLLDRIAWPWDAQVAHAIQTARPGKYSFPIGTSQLEIDIRDDLARLRTRREFQDLCRRVPDESRAGLLTGLFTALDVDLSGQPPRQFRGMTWEAARRLERAGVTFGPHTRTHRILSRLSIEEARGEIAGSWKRLAEELQSPVRVLAWPVGRSGDYGVPELQLAADLGFKVTLSAGGEYGAMGWSSDHGRAENEAVVLSRVGLPRSLSDVLAVSTGLQRAGSRVVKQFMPTRLNPSLPRFVRTRLFFISLLRRAGIGNRSDGVDWSRVSRMVFVCKGNVCRSPYSAAKAVAEGLPAESCGLEANDVALADATARKVAIRRGVDLARHVSRPFAKAEAGPGDLFLAMEPKQTVMLRSELTDSPAQIALLSDWLSLQLSEIPDPYGLTDESFSFVFDLIDDAVLGLKEEWIRSRGWSLPESTDAVPKAIGGRSHTG